MEQYGGNDDLRREGINAVASLMGHIAAATGDRLDASKVMVSSLSAEGLRAADEHLRMCRDALDEPDFLAMLPVGERCAFREQRMFAIVTAFDIVSAALEKR
jgi:hypothetical protein